MMAGKLLLTGMFTAGAIKGNKMNLKSSKGWFNDSIEHGLAAQGIKSKSYVTDSHGLLIMARSPKTIPKPYYQLTVTNARALELIDNKNNLTKKGHEVIERIRLHDTDGDGVPDIVDCEPLNPDKHGIDERVIAVEKEISKIEKIPKVKQTPSVRQRLIALQEKKFQLRKKLIEEEKKAKTKREREKTLKEEVMRERLLLPREHMHKKRILTEKWILARQQSKPERAEKLRSKVIALEGREPKMFVKGTKRLAKLEKEQAKVMDFKRKMLKKKIKAIKRAPMRLRMAKIKRALKLPPDAIARAEAMTATIPTHATMEAKVPEKYRPLF